MLDRFLILWLTLLCGFAYAVWPEPFLATRGVLPYIIAATMFFVGCLMTREEVDDLIRRWPLVLFGTAVQYISMPLLGCAFAYGLKLPSDLALGVIIVACVPDAMASGAVTLMARGNVSYSVSLTICSTIISPLIVPWVMLLAAGRTVPVEPTEVALQLILQVVGPVVLGHLLCRRFAVLGTKLRPFSSTLANLSILWIIAVVVAVNRVRIAGLISPPAGTTHAESWRLIVALLGVNLLGYAAGYVGGKFAGLDEPMRRALTIGVGLQNAGLGASLILQIFPELPGAALPPALYTFGSMWTGTLLATYWSRKSVLPAAVAGDGAV